MMKVGQRYFWNYPGNENIREIISITEDTIYTTCIQAIGNKLTFSAGHNCEFQKKFFLTAFLHKEYRFKLIPNQDRVC